MTRKTRQLVGIGALLGVALAVAWGADRKAMPAANGAEFLGSVSAQIEATTAGPRSLRVATFNVHSLTTPAGESGLELAKRTLADFDFVALQEVRGPLPLLRADQAELLGRELGLAWRFLPSEWRWGRGDFGNGALTRLQVVRWSSAPLVNTRGKAFRNWTRVDVLTGEDLLVHILITHLDRVVDRDAQWRALVAEFLSLPEPAVLLGDLNTTRDDPQLVELLAQPGVHDAHESAPEPDADKKIDWILLRGLAAKSSGVRDLGASDHPCYWAELVLSLAEPIEVK